MIVAVIPPDHRVALYVAGRSREAGAVLPENDTAEHIDTTVAGGQSVAVSAAAARLR